MERTVTPIELRQRLGEILDRVALRQEEYVIARKGKRMAALVSPLLLEHLRQASRLKLLEMLDRPAPGITQREADRLADEAKHATRPRRRGR